MLTLSRGEGSCAGERQGQVSWTLTGLYPYGRYELNKWVSLSDVADYGEGTVTLTPEGQGPLETDMNLMMGALGVRGVAVEAPADGGIELSVTSDAMMVRTSSEAVSGVDGNLADATADVTRLRLGLEGAWRGLGTDGGSTFVPTLEVGLRHDGGDAETGFGVDVGGGLAWTDPGLRISAEVRARGMLSHEAGASASAASRSRSASIQIRRPSEASRSRSARRWARRPRAGWTRCSGGERLRG